MAVIILTDNSFLLNHLFDSRMLFPFEKSARMHGFGHASWRLFACIPGKSIQKEAPGSSVIWDTQENESISEIKPVHAPTPHRIGFPAPVCALVSWSLLKIKEYPKPSPKQELNDAIRYFLIFTH